MVGIYCYDFPLRTAFAAFHKLWYVLFTFAFVSRYFFSFVFDPLVFFSSVLLTLHMFEFFSFSLVFTIWFYTIIVRKMLDMILILFCLVLWPNIWSILENASLYLRWDFLYITLYLWQIRDNFTSSLLLRMSLISFSCLIFLAGTSRHYTK